ncbi:carboxypeptidase N subunit 2-like [Sitophilus oryzae]|uniref:Carboxypeptidase N subunit 2-like n=1 Tax=Sitophilus oryzae TaxID=7048 RepID=A0A6J2X6J8_SITOR|nr:carboxypeptidase N subunit 2-like [Sitophilus oryzae]
MNSWNLILSIILACSISTEAGFIFGQPCSDRNTAYLYPTTWTIPENATQCVDVTGYRNQTNPQHHEAFLKLVPEATSFFADHMNLSVFPLDMIRLLPSVETIDLSGNQLRRIPFKTDLWVPKLSKLMLADNSLFIPKKRPLMRSMSVKMLMLSRNGISRLYPMTFSKLPSLQVLYLDGNKLKMIQPEVFKPLYALKYLHLGDNALMKVPPKTRLPEQLKFYITKSQRKLPIK